LPEFSFLLIYHSSVIKVMATGAQHGTMKATMRTTGYAGALLLFCGVVFGSHAATYFVGESGSDSVAGTSRGSPWQTIQHAVDSVEPGDRIVVLSGEYAGARIERSGETNAIIQLHSDIPGAAVLNTPGAGNAHNSILEIETWDGARVVSCWDICGFTVVDSPHYGIDARSTQFISIRSNRVFNSTVTGIFTAFSYDAFIQGNECATNGEHGIYYNNSSDRFVICDNALHHNTSCGLHMNGDANTPPPVGSPWGWDGTISDGVVEGNEIYQNGSGGAGINMDGVERTVVRNNLRWDTPNNSGIAVFQQDGAVASRENTIANNTIVMRSDGGWALNITDAGCVSNVVMNNVLYNHHTWRGSILIADPAPAGFQSDHNVVVNSFSIDGGSDRVDFVTWRAEGYGSNSTLSTPAALFVGYPTNCHLTSGSPAIDAGTPVPVVTNDMDGISRPLDGNNDTVPEWDTGAYEFVHVLADSDRDSMRDHDEITAGSNPADADDIFMIDAISLANAGETAFEWRGVAGRRYSLSHATNAGSGFELLTNGIPATPPLNTHTVQNSSVQFGFYRLGVAHELSEGE